VEGPARALRFVDGGHNLLRASTALGNGDKTATVYLAALHIAGIFPWSAR